uniref:Uncharacterized protein n=1 Tax=Anguilla anguilla TaxID=7936 RepID=A0A0E9QMZ2_ANGAN
MALFSFYFCRQNKILWKRLSLERNAHCKISFPPPPLKAL